MRPIKSLDFQHKANTKSLRKKAMWAICVHNQDFSGEKEWNLKMKMIRISAGLFIMVKSKVKSIHKFWLDWKLYILKPLSVTAMITLKVAEKKRQIPKATSKWSNNFKQGRWPDHIKHTCIGRKSNKTNYLISQIVKWT